jgi:MFS family permease
MSKAETPVLLDSVAQTPVGAPRVLYGRAFWFAFASNSFFMTAMSVMFRYADFITVLGGTEFHLGWIVGIGTVGSIAMRVWMGSCIDRYGTRIVWLGSIGLCMASSLGHLAVTDCTGVAIYVLRVAMMCSLAGAFGASMTFIAHQSPPERLAEAFALLGTSTYVGALVGAPLGDLLVGAPPIARAQVDRMFLAVAVLAVAAFPCAWLATRREAAPHPVAGPRASIWRLMLRYTPVAVFTVGVTTGMILQLPQAFLRTFAAELSIPRIGWFFITYSVAVIVARILTRRWNELMGTRRLILAGTVVMVVSQLLFLPVHVEWQLALPAIGLGLAQAMLFPTVMAAGSTAFPVCHRGLGTTLVLIAFDVGLLFGSPLAGILLDYSPMFGLPRYPTMFIVTAGITAATGVYYAIASNGKSLKSTGV